MESFYDLCTTDFELSEIVALNQYWSVQIAFSMKSPRPNNALIFFEGCSAVYKKRGSALSFEIPRGALFFVPEGSCYDWTFYDVEEGRVSTVLFEFAMTDADGKRLGASVREGILDVDAETVKMHFNQMIEEFSRPQTIPARLKSAAYQLMTYILESNRKNSVSDRIKCIYRGIKYLEDDPKQSMTVSEIAASCNVSTNYFERLFREYAGCTPTAYRIKKKMERAKVLLAVGDMTVQQVATELGFEDAAYFCRVFKNTFGITPGQINNKRSRS